MQNVYVIRDLVVLSVLGHLMYEKFFGIFWIHRWNDGYPVVMKNIFSLRFEMHYWLLESGWYYSSDFSLSSSSKREKEIVRNVHAWRILLI